MKKTALIAGATGLVGSHCLEILINDDRYKKIIVLTRRDPGKKHPKIKTITADFDKLDKYKGELAADDVFCCLGSTMKKAGSRDNFYKVDFTYVTELARIACIKGASKIMVISSIGASPSSGAFYLRVKGEMEESVKNYDYKSLHIFRPSLLLGDRVEKRPGEDIISAIYRMLSFLLVGGLRDYHAIQAGDVARAMVSAAFLDSKGIYLHKYNSIMTLSAKYK